MKSILSIFLALAFAATFAYGDPDPALQPLKVMPGEQYIFEIQNAQPRDQKSWKKALKDRRFRITAEGYINFPYVGNLKIGGMSFKEAEKALEEALRKVDNIGNPKITVMLPPFPKP
jgi:protein involved in polysaccharide export with SLBB domain